MGTRRNRRIAVAIVLCTLVLTALFLAQGTTGLLAATFLSLDSGSSAPARGAGAGRSAGPEQKNPEAILTRNIFDSDTGDLWNIAAEEVEYAEDDGPPPEPGEGPLPRCEGSVRLVGALVNTQSHQWSFAAITGATGKAMLYREGMSVDDKQVVSIDSSAVVLLPASGSHCQIMMFDPGAPIAATAPARPAATMAARAERPTREGAIPTADMESGITRNSDTSFTVARTLVDQLLTNQAELMRTARVIPHEENGRTVGVKLYGIRRNSILGRLGLQNGDLLRTINGYDMSSPDSALEAYSRM
ncbi:MAG: hypothetical protein JRH11_26385, partial [Deltaproteobacteria bacterium]|nr:hypothetical protein [Deltaproteobacteria bacterium]